MPTTTLTKMSIERVTGLIEAYGSNTQCWPEQERAAAIALLESSPVLQQLLQDAEQLDAVLLSGYVEEQPDEALLARIVDNLPAQPVTARTTVTTGWMRNWPTAMAAAITGIAIMLVVMNGPEQEQQYEQLALQDMDYWLWQDVTDQVSFDSSDEESPTDFMSML